jgi:hypothetical protein
MALVEAFIFLVKKMRVEDAFQDAGSCYALTG